MKVSNPKTPLKLKILKSLIMRFFKEELATQNVVLFDNWGYIKIFKTKMIKIIIKNEGEFIKWLRES